MLTMFVRALVLYGAGDFADAPDGEAANGQLQPFELVFTVIIADLCSHARVGRGIPLLYGVLPMAALMLCYAIFFPCWCSNAKRRGSCSPAVRRSWSRTV